MALYLCLKSDGSSPVTNDNPISTKHTNAGDAKIVEVYIANDGKRKGVPDDDPTKTQLIYTNIQVRVEGVSHVLEKQALSNSISDTVLNFDTVEGWNIGTIIKAGQERMRIDSVLTDKSVSVQRNYTADGGKSFITSHTIKTNFTAESTSVALALPNPDNENQAGKFEAGGAALTKGLDPTRLQGLLTDKDNDVTVTSSKAALYSVGALIKIDEEIMKITAISGNNMTVVRGYENTARTAHESQAVIYCVGLVDRSRGHKIYIQNTPPPGLPTQKKSDIKITLLSDEEPV